MILQTNSAIVIGATYLSPAITGLVTLYMNPVVAGTQEANAKAMRAESLQSISALCHKALSKNGIKSNFISFKGNSCNVTECDVFPLTCVIRKIATGQSATRHNVPPGTYFKTPFLDFFYHNKEGNIEYAIKSRADDSWELYPSDAVPSEHSLTRSTEILSCSEEKISHQTYQEMCALAQKTFDVLRRKWEQSGYTLNDLEIQFGRNIRNADMCIINPFNNESWRLSGPDDKEIGWESYHKLITDPETQGELASGNEIILLNEALTAGIVSRF